MSKVQLTAKTVLQVLEWIETHGHHSGKHAHTRAGAQAFVLSGQTHKLFIPYDIWDQASKYVESGSEFDTRMYRANSKGRRFLLSHNVTPGEQHRQTVRKTVWIYDHRGNRASVQFWGSEEKARTSLATLKNCRDCENCENCENCRWCINCKNCTECHDCTGCENCENCWGCMHCMECQDCTNCKRCKNCTNCSECTCCSECMTLTGKV